MSDTITASGQNTLTLDIVTPERKVFGGDITFVVVPGLEGELGILAGHMSLLSRLKTGELHFTTVNEVKYMAISGGFVEVRDNIVTVAAEVAEFASEIDVSRVLQAKEQALEKVEKSKQEWEIRKAEQQLEWIETQLDVAKRASALAGADKQATY